MNKYEWNHDLVQARSIDSLYTYTQRSVPHICQYLYKISNTAQQEELKRHRVFGQLFAQLWYVGASTGCYWTSR